MKTAMQEAIKEIAELWSSPSDTPNYTQIFEVLESKLKKEKEQIINSRLEYGMLKGLTYTDSNELAEKYYNSKFKL